MRRFLVIASTLFIAGSVSVRASAAPAHTLSAKTSGFPITITDDHGNRIKLAKPPRRIVTLDPRDTEIVFSLNLENRLVADGGAASEGATGIVDAQGKPRPFAYPSEWPSRWGRDYPVRSHSLTHVEGGFGSTSFNLETIETVRPDLVIGPYSKTEEPTFVKMRQLGIEVMIVDPSSFNGILKDISLVGKATGATKQATAVTARMRKQVSGVKKALAKVKSKARVYYEIDATNPAQPYTVGPGTYIDEGIKIAGGKNIADTVTTCSATTCYPQFSLEEIVRLDPQIILFSIYEQIYSNITPDSIKARTGWSTISAVQTGRIHAFNDDLLSRGGPRNGLGIVKLAKLLHSSAIR